MSFRASAGSSGLSSERQDSLTSEAAPGLFAIFFRVAMILTISVNRSVVLAFRLRRTPLFFMDYLAAKGFLSSRLVGGSNLRHGTSDSSMARRRPIRIIAGPAFGNFIARAIL